ncbi:MAG: hypothetical protein ABIP48_07035 [Planctomycetota bacterium]
MHKSLSCCLVALCAGLPCSTADASKRFVLKQDPGDESGVRRLEGVDDFPIVKGGGYFPVLVKLKDGSLGAAVRGGDSHVGIKGRLDWIHSEDGGTTWGFDKRVFLAWKALNSDCGYPSAVQLEDGTIVTLYYAVGTTDLKGWQCRCVRFTEQQLRETME